jgi:2-oxoisovalerate dehydrogenase E1 component alpha subunit
MTHRARIASWRDQSPSTNLPAELGLTMHGTDTPLARGPASHPPDDLVRVLRDDGELSADVDPKLRLDEVVLLMKHMVETRFLDERLTALQRQGRIGFHVGSLGEEGAIIGAAYAMRSQDWLFPCYREFGAALYRGLDFQRFIDNMFGNANDTVQGRQMPDHYTCKKSHWLSISSPVGTQITQAVGFAWAAKLKKEDLATLVYFGDGATSSPDFHSGMNFAGVFKAPVVFFCRNNGWAISVPAERQTASETFAAKGIAYGVPGVRIDGNDLFAVVHAVRQAVERASRGEGPTLIEAITYRMGGHSTSDDPNAYRVADALTQWAERDPIKRVRSYLGARNAWSDEKEQGLVADLDRRFKEAVAIAEATPKPRLETMFEDVYEKPPWHLVEEREELLRGPRPPDHS